VNENLTEEIEGVSKALSTEREQRTELVAAADTARAVLEAEVGSCKAELAQLKVCQMRTNNMRPHNNV
jgi:hypothetical protein